jgi:8-oxo-dGTP pyrophosphatase MutT (NUDIX family)
MNCAGVIVFNGSNVIMVKTPKGHWGFPKGKRHQNESNFACALRELYEETGLEEKDIEFAVDDNGAYYTFIENNSILYYVAKYVSGKEHVPKFDIDELAEVKWLLVEKFLSMDDVQLKKIRKEVLKNAFDTFGNCKHFVKGSNQETEKLDKINDITTDQTMDIVKGSDKKRFKKKFRNFQATT